jgi:AraC-like DNA-binding protein
MLSAEPAPAPSPDQPAAGGPASRQWSAEALLPSISCTVLRAGWFPCQPGWYLSRRLMPSYILFASVGGATDFTIGGRGYRLEPGTALLMPPHTPQEGRHDPATPPMEVYSVHFQARLYGVLDAPAVLGFPVFFAPPAAAFERLVGSCARIVDDLATRAPGFALAAGGECARLLSVLWQQTVAGGPDSRPAGAAPPPAHTAARAAEMARLAPVFHTMQTRYAEHVALEELAGLLHYHPSYFCAYFKRVTGVAPLQFLARYRLDRARELLLSTDLTVAEIADATGYFDAAYLRRVFRQVEGVSPLAYRKAKKNPSLP